MIKRVLGRTLRDSGFICKEILAPKQAYDDGHFRDGAGRRLMARAAPPAVGAGYVALGCSFVML